MTAYDELYVDCIMKTQGFLFLKVRDELPGVDEKWFIENYMKSDIRKLLDEANPKYSAMSSYDLIYYYNQFVLKGEYKKGGEWWGFLPQWAGMAYSLYQWKYNVPSAELIEIFTLSDMERVYPALHQMGWDAAIDRMREIITEDK